MLIDTHCHLASQQFAADELEAILERARASGVQAIVSLATCLEDLQPNLDLASRFPEVGVCLGIHPCDVHRAPDDALVKIASLLPDPRVIGIGETGLDYYHPAPEGWSEKEYRLRQRNFLDTHFQLAALTGLGIIIHTRDREGQASFDDAMTVYQNYADRVQALFHCFIGTSQQADQVLALGGILGFGGVTTFKSAKAVLEVVTQLPEGTFVIETDAPYLAPVPHRGKRNEPSYVRSTAEIIAQARNESLEALNKACHLTAKKFFPTWKRIQNSA